MSDISGVFEHGIGKEVRDVVLADHDLHVNAKIIGVAEDFEDAAASLTMEGGPIGDLDIDDKAFQVLASMVRRFGVMGVVAEHTVRGGF